MVDIDHLKHIDAAEMQRRLGRVIAERGVTGGDLSGVAKLSADTQSFSQNREASQGFGRS